jgi:hypothetical protein
MIKVALALAALTVSASAQSILSRSATLQRIKVERHNLFVDPVSIQGAMASGTWAASDGGTLICIAINARNRLGGYAGRKTYIAHVGSRGADIENAVAPDRQCKGGKFTPAPQLNG